MATKIKSGVIGTLDSNLVFADNSKAVFGAGSDLQIYHDGNNSYIDEAGDGVLFIKSSAGVYLNGKTTDEPLARFIENGPVNLYHDNSLKLATTSTGIDVTGTATIDGLTVQGTTPALLYGNQQTISNLQGLAIYNNQSGGFLDTTLVYGNSTNSYFAIGHHNGTSYAERMRIDSSGRLLAGTQSVGARSAHTLARTGGFVAEVIQQQTSAGASVLGLTYDGAAPNNTTDYFVYARDTAGTKHLVRANGDGYYAGNVGIGTDSPTEKLTVAGAITTTGALSDDRTSTGSMDFVSGYTRFVAYGASGERGAFTFNTAEGGSSSSQKVVIDGLGRIGVGTTAPQTMIHIKTTSPGISFTDTNSFSDTNDRFQIRANSNNGQFQWYDDSTGTTHTHMTLDSSGNVTSPNNSGFQVTGSSGLVDQSSTGSQSILSDRFNTAGGGGGHNVGGDYNTSTGIYTAPVAGRYLFGYTFRWETASFIMSNYIRTYISINDGNDFSVGHQINGRNEAFTSFMAMNGSAIVSLSAGDTVRVKGGLHGGTGKFYASESSFYGILLS